MNGKTVEIKILPEQAKRWKKHKGWDTEILVPASD